jgi:hypothetical protein
MCEAYSRQKPFIRRIGNFSFSLPSRLGRRKPAKRPFFGKKAQKTVLAGMARAPKGAKAPKKRGLLGFLDSKGPTRGSKIDPKPAPRFEEWSKILPLARIFDQGPPIILPICWQMCEADSRQRTFRGGCGTFSSSVPYRLGRRKPANRPFFGTKAHITVVAGRARAPKGAKLHNKRGLFGFLGKQGPKRGWKTTPKPRFPGLRSGQKFSVRHDFWCCGLLESVSWRASRLTPSRPRPLKKIMVPFRSPALQARSSKTGQKAVFWEKSPKNSPSRNGTSPSSGKSPHKQGTFRLFGTRRPKKGVENDTKTPVHGVEER